MNKARKKLIKPKIDETIKTMAEVALVKLVSVAEDLKHIETLQRVRESLDEGAVCKKCGEDILGDEDSMCGNCI